MIRYDDEAGKGDHRHIGESEKAYRFIDLDQLMADFERDIARWTETAAFGLILLSRGETEEAFRVLFSADSDEAAQEEVPR